MTDRIQNRRRELAQNKIIEITCDICGAALDLAAVKSNRRFALDGQQHTIDLCVIHTADFENALGQYVSAARRASGRSARGSVQRRSSRAVAPRGNLKEIREWARANGFASVSNRGRVPGEVLAAWQAAHGSSTSATTTRTRATRVAKKAPARKRAAGRRRVATKKAAAAS
jgi:hypothetical protein